MRREAILRFVLALGVVAALLPSVASSTVFYQYNSTCIVNCSAIGIAPGNAVGGVIGFTDAAVALGAVTSPSDVVSFNLTFGTLNFGLATLGTAQATFSAARESALTFTFITNAPANSPGYLFLESNWAAGPSALLTASGGSGTLFRFSAQAPEPSTAALSLLALGLLTLARRRFRA